MTDQTPATKTSRPPIFGLEWKDFLGLSASALAVLISVLTAISQYVENYSIDNRKHNQILYVSYRIGRNLAVAYSDYEPNPAAINTSSRAPLAVTSSLLASIGIKIEPNEINLASSGINSKLWNYSAAQFSIGFVQIKDLIEAYYGDKAKQLFEAGYFLTLSKYATYSVKSDSNGDEQTCGLWKTEGLESVEGVRKMYYFPKIEGIDCNNMTMEQFATKLETAENAIKTKLSNRSTALE